MICQAVRLVAAARGVDSSGLLGFCGPSPCETGPR